MLESLLWEIILPQTLHGLGLLPTQTTFTAEKRRTQSQATVTAEPFAGAHLTGYEIHTGRTTVQGVPFCRLADGSAEGCVQGNVAGTYLHGLFDTGATFVADQTVADRYGRVTNIQAAGVN